MSTRAADVIRRKRRDGALHTRHATWRINERMMAPLGTNAGSEADANTIADCEFQVKGKPNVEGSDDGSIGLGCFVSWSAKSVTYNGAARSRRWCQWHDLFEKQRDTGSMLPLTMTETRP